MSPAQELQFIDETDPSSKQPRPRACDMCRRKKRRCNDGDKCTPCIRHDVACTYLEPAATRLVTQPDNDHVANLKRRLETAEALLCETADPQPVAPLLIRAIESLEKPFSLPHPNDSDFIDISDSFRALSLESTPPDPGFQGKSSAAMLVKLAIATKPGVQGTRSQINYQNTSAPALYTPKSWENHSWSPPQFPEDYLMVSLVSLYFSNVNFFIPLLHRPTFEACLNRRLHIQHPGFASTLLLVCALGSLYLKDPAVPPHERVRLGSRWYDQVQLCGHALRLRPTLYDLQAYSLASHWLICTSNPRFAWSIVGFGLRLAEDMAAHREKVNGPTTTRGDELEKRAFWILSLIDAQLNATLGRSAIIDPLDIDTSLPAECDDEYWQLSGPGAQPPDRPSTIVFFNCLMNLYRILHFALRALYCTRRSHDRLGLSHPWPVAVRLDGAVLNWFNSLPPHLVWDPVRPHALFFDQSAALHCFYYYTRILIYRPFIPAVGPTTQNAHPSVDICNEAARACIRVADNQRHRRPDNPLLCSQSPIFTAVMVLLLNMWDTSQGTLDPAASYDVAAIHAGMDVLKAQQERWPASEFYSSILERLIATEPSMMGQVHDYGDAAARGYPQSGAIFPPTVPASVNVNAPQQVMPIPPAFVGDEEIFPGRFRRPTPWI